MEPPSTVVWSGLRAFDLAAERRRIGLILYRGETAPQDRLQPSPMRTVGLLREVPGNTCQARRRGGAVRQSVTTGQVRGNPRHGMAPALAVCVTHPSEPGIRVRAIPGPPTASAIACSSVVFPEPLRPASTVHPA